MQMCEHVVSEESTFSLAQAINAGQTALFPTVPATGSSPGAIASVILARSEERRLREAQLYYATGDMTSLALAAASVPPAEPIKSTRLPSPYGLMVFAEPIGGYTHATESLMGALAHQGGQPELTVPIVAVSWGVWTPGDVNIVDGPAVRWFSQRSHTQLTPIPQHFHGVWLTFYSPAHSAFDTLPPEAIVGTTPDGTAMTAGEISAHPSRSPLTWDNETALAFGVAFGEPEPDTTKQWSQVVYTAWQLMSQTGKNQLVEFDEVPRNRAGRKRDNRAGVTGPSHVRIVNVHTAHRPSQAASEQDASSSTGRRTPQWSCRWPVRPYRRNTCLNPRAHSDHSCEHEERIVPAHIKGPADKPLKLGETVHLWDHQPDDN
ncbi:hypothetical protein [Nocardia farcinica]|uniref:hypothetical protein n=1 Tax=Nocardia farcinica TaxID=37329 RepID=UPI001893A0B9|nr:hypothetical protein [Nocardia farcinica]MBF6574138.1 hypothetical protein [Nocardia farcinica]